MDNCYLLSEAVSLVESTTIKAQKLWFDVAKSIVFRKQRVFAQKNCLVEMQELEHAGLVICIDDIEPALSVLGRNDIVDRLDKAGVCGFKRNAKLIDLIAWCIDNVGNIEKITDGVTVAVLDPRTVKVQRKVYTYLLRKFEIDQYFDPVTGEMKDIPKGAEFVATIGAKNSSLVLSFPDDEITSLLNRYGCNRCNA